MAPPSRARPLGKTSFSPAFARLKTSAYVDVLRPNASVSAAHYIRTLSWNASGTFIATGAADRTLRIWNPEKTNVKNSTELRTPGVPGSTQLERVAFHPINENELASCSTDGTVRFWDIRSKASVGEVKVGEQPFTLAWTPDGNEIVAGRKVCSQTVAVQCIHTDFYRTMYLSPSTVPLCGHSPSTDSPSRQINASSTGLARTSSSHQGMAA